jgi:hypothetical protein
MSCVTLKGRWCDIIVLNVHAPAEDKDNDIKVKATNDNGVRVVYFATWKI